MAQILVLDTDVALKAALKLIFDKDEKFKVVFVKDLPSAIEILNGHPAKKAILDKITADSQVVQKEVQKFTKLRDEAKAQMEFSLVAALKLEKRISDEFPQKPPSGGTTELHADQVQLQTELAQRQEVARKEKTNMTQMAQQLATCEKKLTELSTLIQEAQKEVPSDTEKLIGLILVNQELLKPAPTEWVTSLRSAIQYEPNKTLNVVVTGSDSDEKNIKKYLISGISDYLIKPIDDLLAKQNMKFLASGGKELEKEVYSLEIEAQVDLVFEYEIESLCNLSFCIRSKEQFKIGEFRMFNSNLFLRKVERRINAKCVESKLIAGSVDTYLSEFWFIGVDPFFHHQITTTLEKSPVKGAK